MLLFTLISLNVFLLTAKPAAFTGRIIDIFARPLSWETHVALARTLWQNGPKEQAVRELRLADELFSPDVLGASTPPKTILSDWQNGPDRQKLSKKYWQDILTRHPDYRDAYVQLAALAYSEENLIQAYAYLLKAQILDPNNDTVNRLVDFTSTLLGSKRPLLEV